MQNKTEYKFVLGFLLREIATKWKENGNYIDKWKENG